MASPQFSPGQEPPSPALTVHEPPSPGLTIHEPPSPDLTILKTTYSPSNPAPSSARSLHFQMPSVIDMDQMNISEIDKPCWNAPFEPLNDDMFIGREQSMQWINDQLVEGEGKKIAIVGQAGAGKTTLVLMYAHRNRHKYPDGVLWVDASTYNTLQNGYTFLASRYLHLVDESSIGDVNLNIEAVVRYLRCKTRWLLILDNVYGPDVFEELSKHDLDDITDVEEYIPKKGELNGHVIITTQAKNLNQIDIQSANMLALPLFNDKEQEKYVLFQLYKSTQPKKFKPFSDLDQNELDAVRQLARVADGLPLLLEQMTSYMVNNQLSCVDYVQCLNQQRNRDYILLGKAFTDKNKSVSFVYEESFRFVEIQSKAAMCVLYFCAFCHFTRFHFENFLLGFKALAGDFDHHPYIKPFFDFFIDQETPSTASMKVLLKDANNLNLVKTFAQKEYLSSHCEIQRQLRQRLRRVDCMYTDNKKCTHEVCLRKECSILDALAKMFLYILGNQAKRDSFLQKKLLPHIQSCADHFSKLLSTSSNEINDKELFVRCFNLQMKLGRILYRFSSMDEAIRCFQSGMETLRIAEKRLGKFPLEEAEVLCEKGRAFSQLGEDKVDKAEECLQTGIDMHHLHCSTCKGTEQKCKTVVFMYTAIAKMWMQKSDWPKAEKELERAREVILLNEGDRDWEYLTGLFHDVQGGFYSRRAEDKIHRKDADLRLAVEHYEKALLFLEKDSYKYDFVRVWLAYAKICLDWSDRTLLWDARNVMEEVMNLRGKIPGNNHRFWLQTQIKYAQVLFKLGDIDQALHNINAAMEKIPTIHARNKPSKMAFAHFLKGEILFAQMKAQVRKQLQDVGHHVSEAKSVYQKYHHTDLKFVEARHQMVEKLKTLYGEEAGKTQMQPLSGETSISNIKQTKYYFVLFIALVFALFLVEIYQ